MRDFHGKVAIITGAGSGIGRGLALTCAQRGMALGLIDIDPAALRDVRNELRAAGTTVYGVEADVSDASAVQRAVDELRAQLGKLHLVCNNVGVGILSSIMDTSHENFNWLMAVNIGGVFNIMKATVPELISHGEPAHMVITSSIAGLYEMPARNNAAYSATKMGVFALARNLAAELRATPVGVSVLCPGFVATNSGRSGEHRPSRFGGAFTRPPKDTSRDATAMRTDEVARIVMRGVEEKRFLIVTHPKARADVIARNQMILEDFDFWESAIRELGISTDLAP